MTEQIATGSNTGSSGGRVILVTESAVRRIAELILEEGQPGMMLRIYVSGGGCSGFQYGFTFDDSRGEEDHVFAHGDVTVVVDDASLGLLAGSEVDWVEDLAGASFQIRNPNATASCGCGSSFAV